MGFGNSAAPARLQNWKWNWWNLDSQVSLQNCRIALRFISSSSIVELEAADNVSCLLYPDVTPTSLDADFNISSKSFTRHSLSRLSCSDGRWGSFWGNRAETDAGYYYRGWSCILAGFAAVYCVSSFKDTYFFLLTCCPQLCVASDVMPLCLTKPTMVTDET